MTQSPQELLEHLRRVLATTFDAPVHLVPGTMSASGWRVRVTGVAGPLLTITFAADGATALAKALAKPGTAPATPSQVVRDLCSELVSGIAVGESGRDIDVKPAESVEWVALPGATVAGFTCDALGATVAVSISGETGTAAEGRPATQPSTRPTSAPAAGRFGVLMDIDLPLVVRFGCTDMSLKSLSKLGPGSLIDLSRAPEDPVEVLVGGRVVARGEVVVVSGSYGIRIVDVAEGRSQALGMEA